MQLLQGAAAASAYGPATPTPRQAGTGTPGSAGSSAGPDPSSVLLQLGSRPLILSTAESLESSPTGWRSHYTTWVTEAWNVLRWAEPTATLFWEMSTMFHTLFVASLSCAGGGSGG